MYGGKMPTASHFYFFTSREYPPYHTHERTKKSAAKWKSEGMYSNGEGSVMI